MAYRGAAMRLYAAGDPSRMAAAGQMRAGYYAAGGFWDKLKSGVTKFNKWSQKTVVGKALRGVPGLSTAWAGLGMASDAFRLGSGAASLVTGTKAFKDYAAGPGVELGPNAIAVKTLKDAGMLPAKGGGLLPSVPAGGKVPAFTKLPSGLPVFGVERAGKKRRKRTRAAPRRRASTRRAPARRKRSSYSRGDLRESDGRWTSKGRVPMDYPHHGHWHGPKRRKRRGGRRSGQRVSFTTKDGRKVSFTAR